MCRHYTLWRHSQIFSGFGLSFFVQTVEPYEAFCTRIFWFHLAPTSDERSFRTASIQSKPPPTMVLRTLLYVFNPYPFKGWHSIVYWSLVRFGVTKDPPSGPQLARCEASIDWRPRFHLRLFWRSWVRSNSNQTLHYNRRIDKDYEYYSYSRFPLPSPWWNHQFVAFRMVVIVVITRKVGSPTMILVGNILT